MSRMSMILEGLQERRLNEDKWVTMRGTHVLVDDSGNIKNKNLKKKIGGKSSSSSKSSSKSTDISSVVKARGNQELSDRDWDALEKHVRKNLKMKPGAPSDDIDDFIENVLYNEGDYDGISRALNRYTEDKPSSKPSSKSTDISSVVKARGSQELSDRDWDALEKHIRKNLKMKPNAPSDDIDDFIENVLYNEGDYKGISKALSKYTEDK